MPKLPFNYAARRMLFQRRKYQNRLEGYSSCTLGALLQELYGVEEWTSSLQTSRAVDRIYGLLGIAQDTEVLNLVPDYSRDTEWVYTDAAGKMLQRGEFGLLSLAQHATQPSLLPSWVPDWRLPMKAPVAKRSLSPVFRPFGNIEIVCPSPQPNDFRVLEIAGTAVDEIEQVGLPLGYSYQQTTAENLQHVQCYLSQIQAFCRQSASLATGLYGDSDRWMEDAFWRIPIGDLANPTPGQYTMVRATETSFTYHQSLLKVIAVSNEAKDSTVGNEEPTKLAAVRSAEFGKYEQYLFGVVNKAGQAPFITKRGYVGIGPPNMAAEDIICIFYGAHVPYVLRPVEDGRYTLIGETYVYGIMDGEFMIDSPKKDIFLVV
ncbi:hypothetical protein BT63DRAFT_420989 [Microthyrium microscopicum]|uniref:Heterokaryon incompatibility domain-containing protein n=1 Tax=Microthyrium microscopicum TaxID=703497 RepID=A0A6A6ULW8_9PEZI|nr:hypothetical protein BT63DRAFT_420989 [Microthyrium microscopicum]